MKASRFLLAAALFTGLASLSFAGPGPEYWARMSQTAKDNAKNSTKVQPAAQTKDAAKIAAACTTCGCPATKKS